MTFRPSATLRAKLTLAVIAAACLFSTPATRAATINFSSLETTLAAPDNKDAMMYALWTAWFTQVYEYNMPFVEITADADDPAITQLTFTIGDTDYGFSNEFVGKSFTNSTGIATNGEYALPGMSTPNVDYTTSLADNGDTLVIDFLNGGLQPGDTVRMQVDIDRDEPTGDFVTDFAPYTEVFFTANGGDDMEGNSIATLAFDNGLSSSVQLPNYELDSMVQMFTTNVRPYSTMQMFDPFQPLPFGDPIPEPSAALLGAVSLVTGVGLRRR